MTPQKHVHCLDDTYDVAEAYATHRYQNEPSYSYPSSSTE